MAIQEDVHAQAPPAGPRPRRFRVGVVDSLSVAAAAAPFLAVGLVFLFTHDHVLGGDQALIALDAFDVRHLDQSVGPYSRMGWAHPGPAWLVLLAPLYWLFGSTGEALVAASMILHGLVAGLVVVAAGTGRRWQRPLMAAVVLLYVLRMPAIEFVNVWNPFALLLPVMLFLLVAARACTGSVPAFATALIATSFLVQTHIGTVPLVGLVGLIMVVALGVQLARQSARRPSRQAWVRTGIASAVAVLMWIPPLWQQLTAAPGEGNLRMLAGYVLHGGSAEDGHTWRESVSAVGQLLGAPVYGWPATPAPVDTTILTPAVIAAVGVQLLGGVLVAVAGRGVPGRLASWLGVVTVAGSVAALISAWTVTGPLYNYLILWVSVLPAALLFAGLSLLVDRWPAPERPRIPVAVGLTAASIVLAVAVGASLNRSADTQLPDQPGAADAAELVLDALRAPEADAPPVLLDIGDVSVWSTATALALELEQAGYRVSVEETWLYGFGSDRASTGDEQWRVALLPATPGEPARDGLLGVVGAINGPSAVLLERIGR